MTKFLAGNKWAILYFTLLLIFFSHGLFEIIFSQKPIPYIIQLIAVLTFCGIIFFRSTIDNQSYNRKLIVLSLGFLITVIISSIITIVKYVIPVEVILYDGVLLFLFFLFIFLNSVRFRDKEAVSQIVTSLLAVAVILLLAAVIEQIFNPFFPQDSPASLNFFPGHKYHENMVRPASLTGSMLHYPIIMPLIGVIIIRFSSKKWAGIFGVIFLLVPFVTFSRSGILITSIILFLYFANKAIDLFLKIKRGEKININKLRRVLVFTAAIVLTAGLLYFTQKRVSNYVNSIFERITAFQDTGNSLRYSVWKDKWDSYRSTNLLFGEKTAFYTNIVRNILGMQSKAVSLTGDLFVAESSLLELLNSFGLLGTLFYFSVPFLCLYRLLFKQKERLLGFALSAVIIQSFFYQSIEVLPFVFTLGLIPLLANNASKQEPALLSREK